MRGLGSPLLAARDVHVAYGKVQAVRGVSLDIFAGEVVTIVGANGAGKTTLLMALMGLLPYSGELRWFGEAAKRLNVEALVRRGISLIPEKRELFGTMSVADNLRLGAFDRSRRGDPSWKETLEEIYRLFPRLEERKRQLAHTLSGGERQMLAMGRALMGSPRILLLDEPSLGLAPLIVKEIFVIIQELRSRGVAILLVEQNARAALRIADYGYVMEMGTFALQDKAADLASNALVVETYLGVATTERARADKH